MQPSDALMINIQSVKVSLIMPDSAPIDPSNLMIYPSRHKYFIQTHFYVGFYSWESAMTLAITLFVVLFLTAFIGMATS